MTRSGVSLVQDKSTDYEEVPPDVSSLWRLGVPISHHSELPRFIHFRHSVDSLNPDVGKRGLLLTLEKGCDHYEGTLIQYELPRGEHDCDIQLRLDQADIRCWFAGLAGLKLARPSAPTGKSLEAFLPFYIFRRIAISAPSGSKASLIEMASEDWTPDTTDWDCVRYEGWAIDSAYARRTQPVWTIEQEMDSLYEGFVDLLNIRRRVEYVPDRLARHVVKNRECE
jgi:hypothetical protein